MIFVEYDDANQLKRLTLGNGTETEYTYDAAGRLAQIAHRVTGAPPSVLLTLEYTLSADGLIDQIVETDDAGNVHTVTFQYDRRNRLTRETRTLTAGPGPGPGSGVGEYDLEYAYDGGGNRLTKTDHNTGNVTTYTYDISDPVLYGSRANRLMFHELHDANTNLIETTTYSYLGGNTEQIVRKAESDPLYYRTVFLYDGSSRVWKQVQDQWELDENDAVINFAATAAWEYRYDGSGRRRYLARPISAITLQPTTSNSGTWTDLDNFNNYADFTEL